MSDLTDAFKFTGSGLPQTNPEWREKYDHHRAMKRMADEIARRALGASEQQFLKNLSASSNAMKALGEAAAKSGTSFQALQDAWHHAAPNQVFDPKKLEKVKLREPDPPKPPAKKPAMPHFGQVGRRKVIL